MLGGILEEDPNLGRPDTGTAAPAQANPDNLLSAGLATARTRANIPYTLMCGMQLKTRSAGCKANKEHHQMRVRKEDI
jgi:hypothetical protein